jgi:hypothetical protein
MTGKRRAGGKVRASFAGSQCVERLKNVIRCAYPSIRREIRTFAEAAYMDRLGKSIMDDTIVRPDNRL